MEERDTRHPIAISDDGPPPDDEGWYPTCTGNSIAGASGKHQVNEEHMGMGSAGHNGNCTAGARVQGGTGQDLHTSPEGVHGQRGLGTCDPHATH